MSEKVRQALALLGGCIHRLPPEGRRAWELLREAEIEEIKTGPVSPVATPAKRGRKAK